MAGGFFVSFCNVLMHSHRQHSSSCFWSCFVGHKHRVLAKRYSTPCWVLVPHCWIVYALLTNPFQAQNCDSHFAVRHAFVHIFVHASARCQVLSIPVSEWTVPIFSGTVLGVAIAIALHLKDGFDYVSSSRSKRRRTGELSHSLCSSHISLKIFWNISWTHHIFTYNLWWTLFAIVFA